MAEIREIFGGFRLDWDPVCLAPPLARLLLPRRVALADFLERRLPFLRTHLVALALKKA